MVINFEPAHDPAKAATPAAATPDVYGGSVEAESEHLPLPRLRSSVSLSPDWYWATDEEDRFLYIQADGHGQRKVSFLDVVGKTRREIAVNVLAPSLLKYLAAVAKREPFCDVRYAAKGLTAGSISHACISGEPHYVDGIFKVLHGLPG